MSQQLSVINILFNAAWLCGKATNTNFLVCSLTRPGLKPTIYHTRGEHTNHYITDAVRKKSESWSEINTVNHWKSQVYSDKYKRVVQTSMKSDNQVYTKKNLTEQVYNYSQ